MLYQILHSTVTTLAGTKHQQLKKKCNCLNLWTSGIDKEEQKKLKSEKKKDKQNGRVNRHIDNMRRKEKKNEKLKEIEDWKSC